MLYVVLFLLLYVIQITPRLLEFFSAKPFPLIAMAVIIAMFEGEFVGGIYGAFAGLLCDTAAFSLFGFNGLMLCLLCIGIGLLTTYLMQPHVGNALLFVGLSTASMRSLQFLFTYGIFNYDGIGAIYIRQALLPTVYTVALTLLLFFPLRRMILRFQQPHSD